MAICEQEKAQAAPGFRVLTAAVWLAFCFAPPALAASSPQAPSQQASPPPQASPPQGARPMTAYEVYQLYKDKSWRWDDGAGRTMDANRHFSAWVDDGKAKSWATGRWVVTDAGEMCFAAIWHTEHGATPAKTCFSHLIADGTIYQKREPNGAWYVFRHAQLRADDEIRKLVSKDLVSARIDAIRNALNASHLAR